MALARPAQPVAPGSAGHDHALASSRVSSILALEVSRPVGTPQDQWRTARTHSAAEPGEPALGCAPHSRGIAQAWVRGRRVDGLQVHDPPPRPPSQTWRTFLRNHADEIAAIDLCVVHTATFERLFALIIIGHGRRQLLWFAVTRHPTAEWLAQQIVEAFPWETAPTFLIRDNDGAYGQFFRNRLRSMGIRDRPTAPRSPWQNAYVERLIGTLRRECLDHVLIFGERHLRRVLTSYSVYYNETRTLGLDKDTPLSRPVQRSGAIVGVPILSGLHHHYSRT